MTTDEPTGESGNFASSQSWTSPFEKAGGYPGLSSTATIATM